MGKLNGDDYAVGYEKPPASTQFRKGQSGNCKGRPKGTKNFKTDLNEELEEKVTIKEGDRTKKISKRRAIVKTLVTKTLKGDARAANTLIGLVCRTSDPEEPDVAGPDLLRQDELEVLAELQREWLSMPLHAVPDANQSGETNS